MEAFQLRKMVENQPSVHRGYSEACRYDGQDGDDQWREQRKTAMVNPAFMMTVSESTRERYTDGEKKVTIDYGS